LIENDFSTLKNAIKPYSELPYFLRVGFFIMARSKKGKGSTGTKSSCGNGYAANKGFPKQGQKQFISKTKLDKEATEWWAERKAAINEARKNAST
jgi:hypothetical protein